MRVSALLLLALLPATMGYPLFWVTKVLPKELKGAALNEENCLTHPSTKHDGHAAPTPDKSISITVTEAGEKAPVKSLCPGVDYTVDVKYGKEKRRSFLTSSVGAWEGANATCPGAIYTLKTEKGVESFNKTLSIPCNATGDSTTLKVTSAAAPEGPEGAFKTATLALPIAPLAECPKSSCTNASVPAAAANATEGSVGEKISAATKAVGDAAKAATKSSGADSSRATNAVLTAVGALVVAAVIVL